MLNLEKSTAAFLRSQEIMPGGVNSPVRSYRGMDIAPPFIERAEGSKIYDIDGNEYIDYVGSWGPMVLGHAHPSVVSAIEEAARRGTSYGAPTQKETELGELLKSAYPSLELLRMVNSGTEATMSALRLARAYTKRSKILKFIGCYHGHSDSLLVDAGSGLATFGVPSSPGVTEAVAKDTIAIPYNDIDAFEEVLKREGEEIAAVIIEPVAGNMGLVLPKQGYLPKMRELTEKYGILLIFDEVMCGFRVSLGGAQEAYGVKPDLTCLGKIIGGGLPVAAYGGRKEIMSHISPIGKVYQAGTLSGNPLAMAAGVATLKILIEEMHEGADYTRYLTLKTKELVLGLEEISKETGISVRVHQAGSMAGIFFSAEEVYDYEGAKKANHELFKKWFLGMLAEGIYLAPSQYETIFVSGAHTKNDIERTLEVARKVMKTL